MSQFYVRSKTLQDNKKTVYIQAHVEALETIITVALPKEARKKVLM